MMWSFYYWLQSSHRWLRSTSGLPNPAQSEFFPESFINRERDRVPWWWQSCEMLGTEAAGRYVFSIWKKWVIENTSGLREAQTRGGEPQKVHISLSSCTDGLAILWSFYTTCLLINSSFAQAILIGFPAIFKQKSLDSWSLKILTRENCLGMKKSKLSLLNQISLLY